MLAQNFKTHADLGITESEHSALVRVLGMLERGELKHVDLEEDRELFTPSKVFTGHFNMGEWNSEQHCGTVGCIGGTAEMLMGETFRPYPVELDELFYPSCAIEYTLITTEQAACALRSYLTTGKAEWDKALAQ